MNEEKKKFFGWKKLVVIGIIILLVLAMSPLFWVDLIIDAKLDDLVTYVKIKDQEYYQDSKVLVVLKSEYWQDHVDKKFDVKDFKYNNVEKIEYCDERGNPSYGTDLETGNEFGYITIYLKNTGYDEVKKAILKFRTLDFVFSVGGYWNYEY